MVGYGRAPVRPVYLVGLHGGADRPVQGGRVYGGHRRVRNMRRAGGRALRLLVRFIWSALLTIALTVVVAVATAAGWYYTLLR